MKVWPRSAPCLAHLSDDVAGLDPYPALGLDFTEVGVTRFHTVSVIDHHVLAVGPVFSGKRDGPSRCGGDGRLLPGGDVQALMGPDPAGNRILPRAETAGDGTALRTDGPDGRNTRWGASTILRDAPSR